MEHHLSVERLHQILNDAMSAATSGHVTVSGTVTSVKTHKTITAGQLVTYRNSQPAAVLNIVLAEPHRARIMRELGVPLIDGLEITVGGRIETRADWGQLRLSVDTLIGEAVPAQITVDRQQLIGAYTANGGFDAQKKLPLPTLPIRVGAIYGNNSAAQGDIKRILTHHKAAVQLVEAAIYTTGDGAAQRVAQAITELANRRLDVIIVARGGGGRAELDTFDSELIVRAIASSPVPVWTAIGHASDATLADTTAQRSFATPTAAAEEIVRLHTLVQTQQREDTQRSMATRELTVAQQQTSHARTRNRQYASLLVVLVLLIGYLLMH
jgi:exodeoxyribonuclease VII large subunit